jgi:hypothetical protein
MEGPRRRVGHLFHRDQIRRLILSKSNQSYPIIGETGMMSRSTVGSRTHVAWGFDSKIIVGSSHSKNCECWRSTMGFFPGLLLTKPTHRVTLDVDQGTGHL